MRGTNLVCFFASFSCCLVKLLTGILCRLLRRLGSLVYLFLGILTRVRRLALGGTETLFSGPHYLLASIDGTGETFSDRLVDLRTTFSAKQFLFLRCINPDLVRDFCNLLGHCLPSSRRGM